MRILVVGAGATGGYFGARLAKAGRDVTFLVREKRDEQLRRDGLQVVSPHGDITIAPQLITKDAIDGTYDIVLFTVKAFAMDAAIEDIDAAVGPHTMIVPVLNGMRHIDALVAQFGEDAVLGGLAFVSTVLDDAGRIVQLNKPHDLTYGERGGAITERITALDAIMQNAGFNAHVSTRIVDQMWEKWVTLAALGGITCLMRGTIGDIVAAPGGLDFIRAFLAECAAAATGSGAKLDPAVIERTQDMLTSAGSPLASSLYRDLMSGADVEADAVLGDLLIRAHGARLSTPMLATAYLHLKVYQGRR
jgi:2-dehydropantoate 2-reductase